MNSAYKMNVQEMRTTILCKTTGYMFKGMTLKKDGENFGMMVTHFLSYNQILNIFNGGSIFIVS